MGFRASPPGTRFHADGGADLEVALKPWLRNVLPRLERYHGLDMNKNILFGTLALLAGSLVAANAAPKDDVTAAAKKLADKDN